MDMDYARTLNVGGLSRSHESEDLLSGDRTAARREHYKSCSHLNISDSDLGKKKITFRPKYLFIHKSYNVIYILLG